MKSLAKLGEGSTEEEATLQETSRGIEVFGAQVCFSRFFLETIEVFFGKMPV